jgi:hypothetical protein
MEQAKFNSTDSSLRTVGRTELGEDMLDMDFNRAYRLILLAYLVKTEKTLCLLFVSCLPTLLYHLP